MLKERNDKKIKEGDLCLISYEDSAYMYRDISKHEKDDVPDIIFTLGKVRKLTEKKVDMAITWSEDEGNITYHDGIVIPKKAVLETILLKEN